jgi:hypothetical protein
VLGFSFFSVVTIFSRSKSRLKRSFVPKPACSAGLSDQHRMERQHIELIGEFHQPVNY